jgi:hypothetical protein
MTIRFEFSDGRVPVQTEGIVPPKTVLVDDEPWNVTGVTYHLKTGGYMNKKTGTDYVAVVMLKPSRECVYV